MSEEQLVEEIEEAIKEHQTGLSPEQKVIAAGIFVGLILGIAAGTIASI